MFIACLQTLLYRGGSLAGLTCHRYAQNPIETNRVPVCLGRGDSDSNSEKWVRCIPPGPALTCFAVSERTRLLGPFLFWLPSAPPSRPAVAPWRAGRFPASPSGCVRCSRRAVRRNGRFRWLRVCSSPSPRRCPRSGVILRGHRGDLQGSSAAGSCGLWIVIEKGAAWSESQAMSDAWWGRSPVCPTDSYVTHLVTQAIIFGWQQSFCGCQGSTGPLEMAHPLCECD